MTNSRHHSGGGRGNRDSSRDREDPPRESPPPEIREEDEEEEEQEEAAGSTNAEVQRALDRQRVQRLPDGRIRIVVTNKKYVMTFKFFLINLIFFLFLFNLQA